MTIEQLDDYQDILTRLVEEGEDSLARTLAACTVPIELVCTCCGELHVVNSQCKKRWCPLCAPKISARRLGRCQHLAEKMKWPLYVCCTIKNVADDEGETCIQKIKDISRRFRDSVWWKQVQQGGVWTIEVTNIGNGWHPHVNFLIDCRWLAVDVREPRHSDDTEKVAELCKAAQAELCENWNWYSGETNSCYVERAHGRAATEVMKYAVKSQDLVRCPSRIGQIIRAIDGGRLMQRFGNSYGIKWPLVEKWKSTCEACERKGTLVNEFRNRMQVIGTKETRFAMKLDHTLGTDRLINRQLSELSKFRLRAERTSENIAAKRAHNVTVTGVGTR